MKSPKKRVKPENNYEQYGHVAFMPSGACIIQEVNGVLIVYGDGTRRWLSETWFNDVNTNCL